MNRSKGAWLDSFAIKSHITPLRTSVPLRSVFGLMRLHGFVNRHPTALWKLVSNPNFTDGFLLPPGHDSSMRASIINTPLRNEGRTIKRLLVGRIMTEHGVQRTYAPTSICFGCGPANEHGLQIDSYRIEGGLRMEYTPQDHHQAFPGMVNGGIIGTLLDCHGNWTAAIALMDEQGLDEPPCTVTATYDVQLRRPTPMGEPLIVSSQTTEVSEDRVRVSLTLEAGGKVCATGSGLFVAVKEGHPAYHRWS